MAKDLNDKVLYEDTHDIQDVYRSREEAAAYGRSLRDKTPRVSHAGWKAPAGRRDPVDILIESSEGRAPSLIPIRYGRMLQSPFMCFSMVQRQLWHLTFLQHQLQVCMCRHAAIAIS